MAGGMWRSRSGLAHPLCGKLMLATGTLPPALLRSFGVWPDTPSRRTPRARTLSELADASIQPGWSIRLHLPTARRPVRRKRCVGAWRFSARRRGTGGSGRRADASVALRQGAVGSASTIDADAVRLTRANHPNELLVRVPGVWVTRGSGHEHLTAIRSGRVRRRRRLRRVPVSENGIPIRRRGSATSTTCSS